jgi:hypothetical protein
MDWGFGASTRGSVLAEGTEHKHQHQFLAGSSSARVFTVADFLVRISAGLGRVFAALESADVLMVTKGGPAGQKHQGPSKRAGKLLL